MIFCYSFLTQKPSFPIVIDFIKRFSSFYGYKIHLNKSEAMPLVSLSDNNNLNDFLFNWTKNGFVYLGLNILNKLHNLSNGNFAPVFRAVKEDLGR